MILFNAAWVGAYWERLLVRPLEQQRVAGREPPSEQRLEAQPGYLGESQVHHLRHPAPIMATQPTDLLLTDIRATRSRAMDILGTRETPLTPFLRAMDTQAIRDTPLTPVFRATQAIRDTPLTPAHRATDTRTARSTLPTPVPVMVMPCLVIPPIALRGIGRLGPSTLSSHRAEFRPKIQPQSSTPLVSGNGERLRKNPIARRKNERHSLAVAIPVYRLSPCGLTHGPVQDR